MPAHPALVHGALILVSTLFGINYVTMGWVLAEVPTEAWVFFRVAGATALVVPAAVLMARRDEPGAGAARIPSAGTLAWLALAALLGICINQVLFTEGLYRTTAAQAAVINTSIPITTLLVAVVVGQEKMHLRKALAVVSALAGVLMLLRVDLWLTGNGLELEQTWLGNLMILGNATAFSCFLVLMRSLRGRVTPLVATAIPMTFGTVMIALWSGGSIDGASVEAVMLPEIWPWAVFTILGPTVLGYLLNNWALAHTTSSHVALYIYLQPILATALAMGLGEEQPDLRFWVATGLVCVGLLLHQLARR